MSEVLSPEETAQKIAEWMEEALVQLGRNEIDESVLVLNCRGAVVKLTAQIYRP